MGSVDHGMEIPQASILELTASLEGVKALMMETPEELHRHLNPLSTEVLTKASVGQAPIRYLSGNRLNEDIGGIVLKYVPRDLAEVFVPCLFIRNSCQMRIEPSFDSVVQFTSAYQTRFGFLDVGRTIEKYMDILKHWNKRGLNSQDLNHFSYDLEKFVGDVREFELWGPELRKFRQYYDGKVVVCVGDYHVPFVKDVLEDKEVKSPNWERHIDERRKDDLTPQDSEFLRGVYSEINNALKPNN